MKKKFNILGIIFLLFVCFPISAKGADYKVCLYDKAGLDEGYQAALHVVGGSVVLDMYNAKGVINAESRITKPVIYGDGITPVSGITTPYRGAVSPQFLTIRCPKTLCEDDNDIWLDEDGCNAATGTYTFVREVVESTITAVDEALMYEWGAANPGIVQYPSILSGGCPSDVGVFKLFKSAYNLIKIAAPIMLVVFATIDLAKATAASDDSMIKKAQKHCLKRVAGAVIVLLSFVIVEMIINLVSGGSDVMNCINEFIN